MKTIRLWVSPPFAKKIKLEAVKAGKSIVEYTDGLAREDEFKLEEPKQQKKGFYFRI